MNTSTPPKKVINKDPSIQNRSSKKSTEPATGAEITPKKSRAITVDVELLPDDKEKKPICDSGDSTFMNVFSDEFENHDLPKLTNKIRELAEDAHECLSDVHAAAGSAVMHAWLCGVCLNFAKKKNPHGGFKKWFDVNISNPKLSLRTAQRYMKLARKNSDFNVLKASKPTLRQAYIACGILPEAPNTVSSVKMDPDTVAQDRLLKSVTGIRNKLDRFSARKIRLNQQTRDELVKEKSEIDRLFNDLIA